MSSSRTATIKRRLVTIPAMLAGTAIAVFGFPFLATAAVLADLVRLKFRLPTLRSYLFLLQYMVNDVVEILLAPLLWFAAGFGTRLHGRSSIARHQALQWWSLRLLMKRAEQLLGLRVEIDDASKEAAFGSLAPLPRGEETGGPVIVLCRHVSLLDASLPGVLYQQANFQARGVILAELLSDPGFDLLYGRLGSVFIPRDDPAVARKTLARITKTQSPNTAIVIFPEGRLFRPHVLGKQLLKLHEKDPARAARLQPLQHSLPPRPGGVVALLDALPTADVVVMAHTGLDAFPRFADLVTHVPVQHPVTVTARRIQRSDIPTDPAEQVTWLDELWLHQDRTLQGAIPTKHRVRHRSSGAQISGTITPNTSVSAHTGDHD